MARKIRAIMKKLGKERYPSPIMLSQETTEKIEGLLKIRNKRKKFVLFSPLIWGGYVSLLNWLILPEHERKNKGYAILAGMILGPANTYFFSGQRVRIATKIVGNALAKEAKEDKVFGNWLKKYKYVIIDSRGNITGTNLPRILGIGRIRLSTKKILEEKNT